MTIRHAMPEDAPHFSEIEQSAGELFRTVDSLAWIADSENLTDPHYAELIGCGVSWIAQAGAGRPAGFLCAEVMAGELHIHEFAVVLDQQNRGIGTRLLETAVAWAVERDLAAVTLTTFRAAAWNEPFYARAGFETLAGDQMGPRLSAIMQYEIARGLPAELRCAMRRRL